MSLLKIFFIFIGAMAFCLAGAGTAGSVFIDFEDLPVGTVVTNQYATLGVIFSLLEGAPIPGPLIKNVCFFSTIVFVYIVA